MIKKVIGFLFLPIAIYFYLVGMLAALKFPNGTTIGEYVGTFLPALLVGIVCAILLKRTPKEGEEKKKGVEPSVVAFLGLVALTVVALMFLPYVLEG